MRTNFGKESGKLGKFRQDAKTTVTVYSHRLLYWVIHKELLQLNLVRRFGKAENTIIISASFMKPWSKLSVLWNVKNFLFLDLNLNVLAYRLSLPQEYWQAYQTTILLCRSLILFLFREKSRLWEEDSGRNRAIKWLNWDWWKKKWKT